MKHSAILVVGWFFIGTHFLNAPVAQTPFIQDTVISGFSSLQACEAASAALAPPLVGDFLPIAYWTATPCMSQDALLPLRRLP